MDFNFALSQVFGIAALGLKVGSAWLQSKNADARKIRQILVPTFGLGALSYTFMNNTIGAVQYGLACLRASLRLTDFGSRHRVATSWLPTLPIAAITHQNYNEPSDLLPLLAFLLGAGANCTGQGRRQRALYASALATCAIPYALAKGNISMAIAEAFTTAIIGSAVYKYDIKNAAHQNAPMSKDLKAYVYGLAKDSRTNANKAAQVEVELHAHEEGYDVAVEKAWMSLPENPYATANRTNEIA